MQTKSTHYQCTLLPLYQLQQYLTFGSNYRKYTCVNCVEIQKDLFENLPKMLPNEALQLELVNQRRLAKSYEDELMKLRETVKLYNNEEMKNSAKKRNGIKQTKIQIF